MSEAMTPREPTGTLAELSAATMDQLIAGGDLKKLSAAQRLEFYKVRCQRAGLDPTAQPFEYIELNGKLKLYATKACTEQLTNIHKIRVSIVSQVTDAGLRTVTAKAVTADGRENEDVGAVWIDGLKGEALANACMKAVTKAKRRTILSVCGMGMLDESETDSIQGARVIEVDRRTGEVTQAPAARLPERKSEPRTVEATVTKPADHTVEPVPQEIDWSVAPRYDDNEGMICWGVPVSEKTIKTWGFWKTDLAVDGKKTPQSKSCLKDKTWLWASEGSVDGQREQALKWITQKALEDVIAQKADVSDAIIRWREKAVWSLWAMFEQRRAHAANEQAEGFEQTVDVPGMDSTESTPF